MKTNKKKTLNKLIETKARKKIKRNLKTKKQNPSSSQRMTSTKKRKNKILSNRIQKLNKFLNNLLKISKREYKLKMMPRFVNKKLQDSQNKRSKNLMSQKASKISLCKSRAQTKEKILFKFPLKKWNRVRLLNKNKK